MIYTFPVDQTIELTATADHQTRVYWSINLGLRRLLFPVRVSIALTEQDFLNRVQAHFAKTN